MDAYSPAVMISKVTGSVPRFFQYQPCCPHEGGFEGPFILLRVFALFGVTLFSVQVATL